jgi:hypothetical protein
MTNIENEESNGINRESNVNELTVPTKQEIYLNLNISLNSNNEENFLNKDTLVQISNNEKNGNGIKININQFPEYKMSMEMNDDTIGK